jgi:hypothetical protein
MSKPGLCRSAQSNRSSPRIVVIGCSMLFHSKMHASIWVIVFALVALSGSRTIVGPDLAWVVLGGLALAAPVILCAVVSMLWKGFGSRRHDAQLLALADA